MKHRIRSVLSILFFSFSFSAWSHGFNADWVYINRMNNGKIRVTVKYTNLHIGEYREVYVDFKSAKEAIDVYQKLARGADFFWGDQKITLHFHTEPEKTQPY